MGFIARYDTYFNDETGEWLEKIGFCDPGTCDFCDAYEEDGRPPTAFDVPKDKDMDRFPW